VGSVNGASHARSSVGSSSDVTRLGCGKDFGAANPSATRLDAANLETTDPDAAESEEHPPALPNSLPDELRVDEEREEVARARNDENADGRIRRF
jgi:hypothetical protein